MNELAICAGTALWLGLVTSVSPCPLATNVAAIGVLSRRVDNRGRALAGVATYTLGRATAYVALALLIVAGLAGMPSLSAFLRNAVVPVVGPLLLLAGAVLMGWLPLPIDFRAGGPEAAKRLLRLGLAGEFLLGALFAMSFCPVSAALFFGSLMPLVAQSSVPLLPVALYGLGTALPVAIVAVLVVLSAGAAARMLGLIQKAQLYMTKLTGAVLMLIGAYLTLSSTMGLF